MKGIIFNAEMVNTILDTGVLEYRKTCKVQPTNDKQVIVQEENSKKYLFVDIDNTCNNFTNYFNNPFGKIGDQLFIKEGIWNNDGDWEYGADDKLVDCSLAFRERYCSYSHINAYHTKQEQSRLTVEITNIKVEKADVWEWVVNFKLIK